MSTGATNVADRMPLVTENQEAMQASVFAEEVASELGYKPILRQSVSLQAALNRLGIRPYTQEWVRNHKWQVRAEAFAQMRPIRRALPKIRKAVGWASLSLFLMGLIVLFVSLLLLAPPGLLASLLFSVTGFFLLVPWNLLTDYELRTDPEWETSSLDVYNREIPLKALEIALTIKRNLPKARFSVRELTLSKSVADPLLFVELAKERYCIAVWNEPGFEVELV